MPAAAVPNVPAWKRLGLKLKSAQSTPESAVELSTPLESTKRKRLEDAQDNTPSKKTKNTAKTRSQTTAQIPFTPKLEHKKSVTFTPETKHEDGDSIKQLFNSWVAEQKSQDPSFDFKSSGPAFQVPEPSKVEEVVDTNLDEKERKVKRVKQPKKEKTPNKAGKPSKVTKVAVAPSRPFLQYLRQYSESRDTWKFNKNHQNQFIRSIFSVESIPSDHAHFIYHYIQGLQGGVRTRLRDTAFAVKVKDEEDGVSGFPANMSNREQKQQEYEAAKANYLAAMKASRLPTEMGYEEGVLHNLSDNLMRERVAQRLRAEQILHELGSVPEPAKVIEVVGQEDESQNKARPSDGKVARKRKQRTAVEEEESSSSDDSSDSESDSDSDETGSSVESGSGSEGGDTSSSSSSSSSGSESGGENEEDSSEDSEDSSSDSE